MSPLYIKMRPDDNVTVDMRDLTASESLIMLDYGTCAGLPRTDSALEDVQLITVPEHDDDDDMQPVCDSHQPSSSNELYDNSQEVSDSNEAYTPETSIEYTKTHSITDISEYGTKYRDIIEQCDTSQIVSCEPDDECSALSLTVPQNITACSDQLPDSSTAVDWIARLPDKPQKSALNKEKFKRGTRKPTTKPKFDVNNFIKYTRKSSVIKAIAEQSNITENASSNVDSEMCNFKNSGTKSGRKGRKVKEPCNTKLVPNKEQNTLEEPTRKKVTKSRLKPQMNLDKNEDTQFSKESRKSTSKLKQKRNSVESDEPITSAEAVNVKNAIEKKNKRCLEENQRTKKETVPKLKGKMKLKNGVLRKSRKYVIYDTSDEEEISVESSTTEVSSKLDEHKDAPKKTDKKDKQKDFNNIPGNRDGKTVLKKKIKLDENRQTTAPTEHFVVQSKAKLVHKKQSSELVNVELKLPTLPVTIKTEKLKSLPKFLKKGRTNFKNKEQPEPSKEFQVERNLKKINEPENSTLTNGKLAGNWNMHPLSPIPTATETLQQRWAETGLIDPLDKNLHYALRRRRALLELQETFTRDNPNSNGKVLGNPLASVSESLTEYSFDESRQYNSYLAVPGLTNLYVKEGIQSQETILPNRQISYNASRETPIAHESLRANGIIMPSTENAAFNNRAPLPREVDLPTPFLVPSVPPPKRIRRNTHIEHQTLPLKPNIAYDSYEDRMERESRNTSEECSARNKHSFNFVDTTVPPPRTKCIQKVKTVRPDMSDIVTSNNRAPLPREVDLPTPFLVPSVPPPKRIRRNTHIEHQTVPLKPNIAYDSYEDRMERESRNTSEECSARNKHSFNFVDTTVPPPRTKCIQKVKTARPDMSDIVTSNDTRIPFEDDSISIYAESLRTDSMSVMNDCDLDDMDNETSSETKNIVSEWIRHSRGHTTDNATLQNTNNIHLKERAGSFKYPRIKYNMTVEDEAYPPTSNSGVEDSIERTEYTNNFDTLHVFEDTCRNFLNHGICKKVKCNYKHILPRNWEITLQNMPKDSLQNLYNNIKHSMYIFKKMFPIVAKQLALLRDYNSVICLVKDVIEIDIDADRTLNINVIIDELRSIGMTFNSVIDVIFNSTFEDGILKDQLTDILINICLDQDDIASCWSTIIVLMKYRNYRVNARIIKTILRKCLIQNKLQKELCLGVYSDLISHISDDRLGPRYKRLLNDYIKCMRSLGLVNEAQMLYERFAVPSRNPVCMPTGSTRSKFVSEARPLPSLFDTPIQFPVPSIPSPPPQIAPIVNKVMPRSNKPNLVLNDAFAGTQPSNVPFTSATVAPYVEEIQTCGMNAVQQAIFKKNMPQLMSLIREYKDGDLADEFLETCLDAMQESTHNFDVLFRNLCQSVTVFQDIKMDKSLEYVLQTIGNNLIIYATNNNKWDQAYNIYQMLRDLYNDADIKNIKMFMFDKPSYIKRLLITCEILVKHNDWKQAWDLFKVNRLHTSRCWTEATDQQHVYYRNLVFTALMTGLSNGKQWDTVFKIIEYIFKNKIYELDPIVDTTIQMAVEKDCHTDHIVSFMKVYPVWYKRIHRHTFRVIAVKLVRNQMYRSACIVYRQGCKLKIYPQLIGNEKCLKFSTHYVPEEILLILKDFLHNMVRFMPVRHTLVIKAQESAEAIDRTATQLPKLLQQYSTSFQTMHVRIVNILNNHIKPPIRVVNRYSHLEITPAELEKHLEVRRK